MFLTYSTLQVEIRKAGARSRALASPRTCVPYVTVTQVIYDLSLCKPLHYRALCFTVLLFTFSSSAEEHVKPKFSVDCEI